MKIKYLFALFIIICFLCFFAYGVTYDLKEDFFKAESIFSHEDLDFFDNALKKGEMTQLSITSSDGESNLDYSIYCNGSDKYYLESDENFDFTIITDGNDDELLIPSDIIGFLNNPEKYEFKICDFFDEFYQVLRKNTDQNDYSSNSVYVKIDGIIRKSNVITMKITDSDSIVKDMKTLFSSSVFSNITKDVFGSAMSRYYIDNALMEFFTDQKASVIFNRSIVGNDVIKDEILLTSKDNTYKIVASDNSSSGLISKSLIISDSCESISFNLTLQKQGTKKQISFENSDFSFEAVSNNDLIEIRLKDEFQRNIKILPAPYYKPQSQVYDMSVPKDERVLFVRLSQWIKGNSDAALLFRTYETKLKP